MATVVQPMTSRTSLFRPFLEFLKEELAPYPGRAATVGRMVLAATIIMTICMTFRIPYGFQAALFPLLVSRENVRATVNSTELIFAMSGIGIVWLLISAWFVISFPVLHFVWNIGSFFLCFYVVSVATNYVAGLIFSTMVSVGVPFWDRLIPAEANVEDTLRLWLSVFVGLAVTAAVELALVRARPGDNVLLPVTDRLAAVHTLLVSYAEERSDREAAEKKVIGFGLLGTSALFRALRRSDYSPRYRSEMGGAIALTGRLVNVAAALTQLRFSLSATDRAHLNNLASAVAGIRAGLLSQRIPGPIQFDTSDESSSRVPLLREMESIVALIPQSFAGILHPEEYLPAADDRKRPRFFVPDAFVNADHLKFALKGCLAAGACYFIYNAIDWPGISTAVATCLFTALSTIGASRQKQILRLAGAIAGGFVFGMGSQIFILPYIDSITGFAILFAAVTAVAGWFMTSTPRLSYFGVQVALTYYLINLQEFAEQTSLAIARDRVVGVLLGLFMMWVAFDQIWGAPAGVAMKKALVSTLRLLAQLSREPVSLDRPTAVKRSLALRETINASFDQVRALADGVLFEFGPSRHRDLALRDHFRRWQPRLRTLFLMRMATLQYRLQLPGFELPEPVRQPQKDFDDRSAQILDDMADRIEGRALEAKPMPEGSVENLEQTLWASWTREEPQLPAERIRSLVALLRGIDTMTTSLNEEIAREFDRPEAVTR